MMLTSTERTTNIFYKSIMNSTKKTTILFEKILTTIKLSTTLTNANKPLSTLTPTTTLSTSTSTTNLSTSTSSTTISTSTSTVSNLTPPYDKMDEIIDLLKSYTYITIIMICTFSMVFIFGIFFLWYRLFEGKKKDYDEVGQEAVELDDVTITSEHFNINF